MKKNSEVIKEKRNCIVVEVDIHGGINETISEDLRTKKECMEILSEMTKNGELSSDNNYYIFELKSLLEQKITIHEKPISEIIFEEKE